MNKLNVFTYNFLPWRYHFWRNIKQFFQNLKGAWQRATKGYCDSDLWNLDYFYSQLFVNTLTEFSERVKGCPAKFFDKDKVTDDNFVDEWKEYLKEMRNHFYNSIEENNVQPIIDKNLSFLEQELTKMNFRSEELEKALDMLKEVYFDLWW